MEILNVKNLSYTYNISESNTISDISFSLDSGDFLLITGSTGSGKSTLLRLLKRELTPEGKVSGEINIFGVPIGELSERDSVKRIGFVTQYPEEGIVTDKVWHELSFGLENLGTLTDIIRRKTAEMASYFGIEHLFEASTDTLSGGQKQLLSLASAMATDPDILILDEPTSRLDPITASEFLATVYKLNRELGTTVIIVEHRLEEVISYANRILSLDFGRLTVFAPTRKAIEELSQIPKAELSLPSPVRLYLKTNGRSTVPITVSEGRSYIESTFKNDIRSTVKAPLVQNITPAVKIKGLRHRYERSAPDILRDLSLTVYHGECLALLGGNGSGKSTLLSAVAGLIRPYAGKIEILDKKITDYKNGTLYQNCIAMLPQDVKTCFLFDTVKTELDSVNFDADSFPIDLSPLYDLHPYDISGGQMQLVALAKVLTKDPLILLLDEPTKGLDAYAKKIFQDVIKALRSKGMTVILVTHDTDLAAEIADHVALLFRGEITSYGTPRSFFGTSSFFTTSVSRMTRGHYDIAVTLDSAAELCSINGRRE